MLCNACPCSNELLARSRSVSVLAAVVVTPLASCGACARGDAHRGATAELRQDYDIAVVEYTKAVRLDPDDSDARHGARAREAARLAGSLHAGRRLAATASSNEALVEYQIAAELNPANGDIDDELRATRNKLRAKIAVARRGQDRAADADRPRARAAAARHWTCRPASKMPASLTFRDASSRDVFTAIARLRQHQPGLRPGVPRSAGHGRPAQRIARDALNTVAGATRTFFRVTAPRTVIVIPDTPAKRREYEEEIVRTFYLSNADLKETMDLLRMVLDARRISPTTATNALTIKDTPERIAAAGTRHLGDRQGAARSDHRRRAARGRSHASCRSTACRSPRPASPDRHQRLGRHQQSNRAASRCRRCAT